MIEYIDRKKFLKRLSTEYSYQAPNGAIVVGMLADEEPANVRPVEEIDEAVEEAIRILNAINSRGDIDYADYCEMYDAIYTISPNYVTNMREE